MAATGDLGSNVFTWRAKYHGALYLDQDPRFQSIVYGWDTNGLSTKTRAKVPDRGAVWGFLVNGRAEIISAAGQARWLREKEFFLSANGFNGVVHPSSKLFAVQQLGFLGLPILGGPIEPFGRLRYIDGCSDTILVPPFTLGDPCLNHLHFPSSVTQTYHVHPSLRAGVVVRGQAVCRGGAASIKLKPGLVFVIPPNVEHAFETESESLDIIAYHPDSDSGPTHEDHPMINRTLVNTRKIDNSGTKHATTDIVQPRFIVDDELDTRTQIKCTAYPEGS